MILNFKSLSKNALRRKALLIANAGYEAIDIEKLISRKIKIQNGKLFIKSAMTRHSAEVLLDLDLSVYKKIFLIGIGKGSALASLSLAKILGNRLSNGIALDVQKLQTTNHKLQTFIGSHPFPSGKNIKATKEIVRMLNCLNADDLLITFICGGGSALLCGLEKEMRNSILATKKLTETGADIFELNIVRKHLSELKGGGLAKLAYPATVVSLIVSDVPGNDLSTVASGPTVFDKTTRKDAEKIWKKYQYQEVRPPQINGNFRRSNLQKLKFHETPKDKKYFEKVKNILFLSNQEPILAMAKKANEVGFKPKIYSLKLKGEAKNILLSCGKACKKGGIVLAGGETTIKFKNPSLAGKGGRNMEAVLAALTRINACILSVASDGRDNTEAAGAIGDNLTIEKAKKLKLEPKKYLENHNSFNFFKKTGDLIYADKKSFNVADLMLVLSSSKE